MDLISNLPPRIHEILDEGARGDVSRVAFTDEHGVVWSYRRLIDTVELVAIEMSRLGIRPGDRVMIVCENSIAAIVLLYALSRIDAWAVVTNARLSQHGLDLIENDCQPRRVFYTHAISPEADAHACRRRADIESFIGIGEMKIGRLDADSVAERVHRDSSRQVAVVIYKTGTTGRPKGVMLSHRSLAFVACRGKRTDTIRSDDVSLCVMPISHSYGLTLLQGMLFAGAHLRIMPRFALAQAIDAIADGALTIFATVPALLSRIVAHVDQAGLQLTPNRLRYVYSGTAPLDLSLRRDEVNIGPPIPGVEIKIVGADGHEVEEGLPGELLVRGPNVMLGYYGQPELTAEVIDEQGYLKTGDIVSRNTSGELIVQGRSKELIIRSGFNVYPPEIEAVLNTHPTVLNSAVVGRSVEGNEEIIAFVQPVPGGSVETNDLFTFIEGQLARYKKPQQIIVMQQLPVAPNGKIRKHDLKKYAEASALSV